MHPFMASVLLRTARLNALMNDPHLHPSERELRQPQSSPSRANGAPLSVRILEGIPYSRIAASQTALTWLKSIRETI